MIEMAVIPKQPLNDATAIAFTTKFSRKEPTTEVMPSELWAINPSGSEFDQPRPSRRVPVNSFVEKEEIMETKNKT
jgi:hypothetical protein